MSIYKACDIRGVVGDDLTPDLFRRMGRGIALMMGGQRDIVVGGDLRPSTPELKAALVEGLCDKGRAVSDVGTVPTPLVYFAKDHLPAYACAIITASHNPPQFNGLKFMVGNLPVLPEDVGRLRDLVAGPETASDSGGPAGRVSTVDLVAAYEEWVLRTAEKFLSAQTVAGRGLKVIVDAGNGASSEIAPRVLDRLPQIEVERLFCVPDGTFPDRDPDSAVPENLRVLRARVADSGADIGVAFDGDGDRVAFVDETGAVLSADEMLVILLRAQAARLEGERVVYDLKCSQVVAREVKRLGAVPLMEKAGHAFIKRRMIQARAILGGEISGHYFYRELHGGDDGLFSAIVGLRILQQARASLSDLRRSVPPRFITEDVRIAYPPERTQALLAGVRDSFPKDRQDELDGIRVSFPCGWALLRTSITEPKITLRFEGENAAALEETVADFLAPLPELRETVYSALGKHGDTHS